MQKTCKRCLILKDLGKEFYTHSKMADGHLNFCKKCTKKRVHKHYEENREQINEYDRQRSMLPHRVLARAEYMQTERGKEVKRITISNYTERYPEKYKAKNVVSNAIRDGKLFRRPCEVCGDPDVQAHHDDYSKPLSVRWLCVLHHNHQHGKCISENNLDIHPAI